MADIDCEMNSSIVIDKAKLIVLVILVEILEAIHIGQLLILLLSVQHSCELNQ